PVAFVIALWLGTGSGGLTALGAAFGLGGIYNLWGKRTAVPLLMDFAQSLSWASLALFGALAVGEATFLTWVALSFVAVYVLMVNGVHGGLRDLRNDLACGVRSTAIQLGAHIALDGRLLLSARLRVYAAVLQSLLVVIALLSFLANEPGYAPPTGRVALAVVLSSSFAAFYLLWSATRPTGGGHDMGAAGLLHMVSTMIMLMAALLPRVSPGLAIVVVAVFTAPLLTHSLTYRSARLMLRVVRRAWPV
ncbi:MAG: hypothetical protein ACRELX_11155, partial [Longimicrobiales bacterium]